jgi:hypothetical protein
VRYLRQMSAKYPAGNFERTNYRSLDIQLTLAYYFARITPSEKIRVTIFLRQHLVLL